MLLNKGYFPLNKGCLSCWVGQGRHYFFKYMNYIGDMGIMEILLRNMASLYIIKDNKMLLLYRQGSRVVNNMWVGSAGGHFEENELNNPKACILRELQEELGITGHEIEDLHLRYITLRRMENEVRQNYYFFAKLKDNISEELSSNEGISKWFSLSELAALEMPFTAKHVIEHYLNIGYKTDILYGGIANREKVLFTEF